MARAEIDPQLPYIQVHRSSALKAASLGALLGVTPQHARGAVLGFWENLSDRRTLRAGLERPDGPGIILSQEDVEGQLLLAFGTKVDPRVMVLAGFLEPLPGGAGYRVRGMSRQLDTEAKRLRATGWSPPQPRLRCTSGVPQPPLSTTSTPTSAPPEVAPSPADVRRETEEVRRETGKTTTTAVVVANPVSAMGGTALPPAAQRELADRRHLPRTVEKPTTPPEAWLADDFWAWAQFIRQKSKLLPETEKPRDLGSWYSAALMTPGVDVHALKAAFYEFGRSPHWEAEAYPFRAFIRQWAEWVNKEKSRAS